MIIFAKKTPSIIDVWQGPKCLLGIIEAISAKLASLTNFWRLHHPYLWKSIAFFKEDINVDFISRF